MLRRYGSAVVAILIVAAGVLVLATAPMQGRGTRPLVHLPSSPESESTEYPADLRLLGVGQIQLGGETNIADLLSGRSGRVPEAGAADEEPQRPAFPVKLAPTKPAASESQWKAIGGDEIWAVAWSPDGDRIAFVSVDERGDDLAIEGHDISRAVVWLMENPGNTAKVSFRKLARRTMEQQIPVGLFWLSEQEVGWAASAHYPEGFRLYAAGLSDGEVRRISNRRIGLHYVEHAGSEIWDGPGDLYFDPISRRLFLTGDDDSDGQPVCIVRYNPADDSLDKRKTSLTGYAGICAFTGSDGTTSVYLCSWDDNPPEPIACVWPNVSSMWEGVPQGEFIRVSPNGRMVSWLAWIDSKTSLVLYDRDRKTAAVVARWDDMTWMGSRGCPYSWSPDGKQIAHSDGHRIRVIQVNAKQPHPSK